MAPRPPATGHSRATRLARPDLLVAAVLAVVVTVLGGLRLVPGRVGTFQDDGVYVATARALAEGDGYRLVNEPGAPPQTRYPILYPALLSVAWRIAPSLDARLTAMQVLTIALAALAVALAYLYVRRFGYAARPVAVAAGIVTATAPLLTYFSANVLSEMPFALVVVVALWMTDHARARPDPSPLTRFAVGVLLGLPFLTRTIGIVVPPVALAVLAVSGRRIGWYAAGAGLVVAPWIAWVLTMSRAPEAGALQPTGYVAVWLWSGAFLDPAVLAANVRGVLEGVGWVGINGAARWLYPRSDLAGAAMIGLGTLAVLGLALRWRRGALAWAVMASLAVLVVWPWPPERFLAPIMLPLLVGLFGALYAAASRVAATGVAASLVLVLAVGAAAANMTRVLELRALERRQGLPFITTPDAPSSWASFAEAFAWLRGHTAPGDTLAAGLDSMTALYTGRATIRPYGLRYASLYRDVDSPLGDVASVASALRDHRVRFLLVSPMPGSPEEQPFQQLVASLGGARPALLRPVYRGGDPRFVIFEVAE